MKNVIKKLQRAINHRVIPRISSKYKLNYKNRGIINFIDVGSIGGLPPPWRANACYVKYLLNFEPNESPLQGRDFMTYNTALWESDATLPFYIHKGINGRRSGSSLFRQNYDFVKSNYDALKDRGPRELADTWFERSTLVRQTELKCRSLDNVIMDEFPDTSFHFVKIDAQGAEYNILKGAKNLLSGTCLGLHLELFTVPLYDGIVLLEDVEAYLAEFGFRMVKQFPAHGTFDSQHDCLFLKEAEQSDTLSIVRKIYEL